MKRIDTSLSLMRVTATCAVVYLHVCSTVVVHPELFSLEWGEQVFFRVGWNAMRWAVPLFLMITGALLLSEDREITPRVALTKYALRLALALLIFGWPMGMAAEWFETRQLGPALAVRGLLRMLTNESFVHLWYIHMLMGVYLLLPLLKAAVKGAGRRTLQYSAMALLAGAFLLPTIEGLTGARLALSLPVTWPVFYLLAGHLLYSGKLELRPGVAAAGLIASVAVNVAATALRPGWAESLYGYNSPVTASMAIAMFALLRGASPKERIWRIDRLCFGVYIIHPLFIQAAYRLLGLAPVGRLYPLKALAMTAAVLGLSACGSLVLRSAPFMRKHVL